MASKTATAKTAEDALRLYREFMSADALIQSTWHTEQDGRQLACALGVLGKNVDTPLKCPSAIMPRWLAQMVPWLFDRQKLDDAKTWGERFYAALARVNGDVPFSVVHDWHAKVVGPLVIEVATKRNRNVAAHEALAAMQTKAAAGEKFTADEWRPILKEAFRDAYAYAYAYANAEAAKRLADGMVECLLRLPAKGN